jgi:hypothetical protein
VPRAFSSDAKLARAAGLAPIPVSSGRTDRHRLDRGGNRQINAAIHRVAVTRAHCHPETIEFLVRKKTEGKTHREAVRSLKRHLARRIWQLLRAPHPVSETPPHHQLLDTEAAEAAVRRLRRAHGDHRAAREQTTLPEGFRELNDLVARRHRGTVTRSHSRALTACEQSGTALVQPRAAA